MIPCAGGRFDQDREVGLYIFYRKFTARQKQLLAIVIQNLALDSNKTVILSPNFSPSGNKIGPSCFAKFHKQSPFGQLNQPHLLQQTVVIWVALSLQFPHCSGNMNCLSSVGKQIKLVDLITDNMDTIQEKFTHTTQHKNSWSSKRYPKITKF